jgi:hypothetical protein
MMMKLGGNIHLIATCELTSKELSAIRKPFKHMTNNKVSDFIL